MVLQRTFEAAHLKDYLRSAEGIYRMFAQLGYDVYDPEPIDPQDIDMSQADVQHVRAVYLINGMDFGHTVWLFEVDDTTTIRLRGLAYDVLQRPGTHTLLVTKDYSEVIIAHPYFVGGVGKSHTRVNKLKIDSRNPTRHDVDTINALLARGRKAQEIYKSQDEAFNVTAITRKFYDEYRRHYEHARALIRQYNPGVREFQDSDQTDKLHAFTQRLLGRLMFLYFLQRKGWLGERQKFLTEKYIETLRKHAHELHGDGETFHYYTEVLEPLFFATMNTQRPGNITQWNGIRIPYLNGGLFDESRDPAGPIIIPDVLFDPNSNEGLLAFFNRYNFTIEDDTPLEQDVSVDPEMLGKVFENMLEERDRGQSGSFYTPRTIVAYMCQESLIGYLEESAQAPRETTRAQFDPDSELRYTPQEAERVNAALDTLTVLDPAVGSGSFLIGMLTEMMRLRKACYAVLHEGQDAPSALLADWKEAIIRDTLYGVDIKPEAIEIAQLRLWLALVVDQTLEQARPLPNLDYKLMAGNSLIETIDGEPVLGESAQAMIGADVTPRQPTLGMFEADKERFKLDALRAKFFRATPQERRKLREDISAQERRIVSTSLREKAEAQEQIINALGKRAAKLGGKLKSSDTRKLNAAVEKLAHLTKLQDDMAKPGYVPPFFLYRMHFSEVFERKGGFDVIVANPPYVRGDKLGKQKDELKEAYPDVFGGRADLYVYFYVRAHQLLRAKGQLSFITSGKYMRAKYGKGLRKFLTENVRLFALMDFGDLPVFDATAYPCILLGTKDSPSTAPLPAVTVNTMEGLENLHNTLMQGTTIKQDELGEKEWQITDNRLKLVFDKLKAGGELLGKYVDNKIYRGVVTGLNEAFIIDEETRQRLITTDPMNSAIIKPFLAGRDINRWTAKTNKYIIFTYHGINIDAYPSILEYLLPFKELLEGRATSAHHKWYELQQPQMGIYREFDKPKIVWGNLSRQPAFGFSEGIGYVSAPANIIPIETDKLFFVLAFLNSKAGEFVLNTISASRQNDYFEYKPMYVSQIPIPDAPDALREKIARVAQQCLDAAKSKPAKLPTLEAKLNQLVYQAYGLDADDIAVIEGHLSGSAGAVDATDEDEE